MKLAHQLRKFFLAKNRTLGETYFRTGRVKAAKHRESLFTCQVVGSSETTYRVSLEWRSADRQVKVDCSCPHFFKGNFCKHLWSGILEFDKQGWEYLLPSEPALGIVPSHPWETGTEDNDDSEEDLSEEEREDSSETKRWYGGSLDSRKKYWWHQISQIAGNSNPAASADGRPNRVIWYEIEAPVPHEGNSLQVHFWQQLRTQKGLGKLKPLKFVLKDLPQVEEKADRDILELFTGVVPQSASSSSMSYALPRSTEFHSAVLSPASHATVIPMLANTGRFGYFSDYPKTQENFVPIQWDNGSPFQFEMEVTRSGRHWEVKGYLVRDQIRHEISEAVSLFQDGIIVFKDKLARHDASDFFAWLQTFHEQTSIRVPASQGERLFESLSQFVRLPKIHWPDELKHQTVELKPTPVVAFEAPPNWHHNPTGVWGTLKFRYGQREVGHASAPWFFVDKKKKEIANRDLEVESKLIQSVHELGVKFVRAYEEENSHFEVSNRLLPKLAASLVGIGCEVQLEKKALRPLTDFSSKIRSGIDWFDLKIDAKFGSLSADLPEILEQLRKGKRFVRLTDGSQGILPEEWVQRWLPVLGMAQEEREGVLRFKPSQAVLLNALLLEKDKADWDDKFLDLTARLEGTPTLQTDLPANFTGKLRSYQEEGLGWLTFLNRIGLGGCLADDMGLGKTVQVLALLELEREKKVAKKGAGFPSIVVVPKSLVFNWLLEAKKFTPELRASEYRGKPLGTSPTWLEEWDVLVITYGMLREHFEKLREIPFQYVILDEAQAIKNPSSQTAKAARLLQAKHRLVMTGTPIENHLKDFWSLFEFLNPGMLGSLGEFQNLFGGANATLTEVAQSKEALSWLSKGLRPFVLRRTKEQVLTELPSKTEQTLYCELDTEERKLYDELRAYYQGALAKKVNEGGLKRSGMMVLEALLRLRQAACHPRLIQADHGLEESTKIRVLLEQLEEVLEGGHKALVFSQFTSFLSLVRAQVEKKNIAYEYLDGSTRNRDERVKRFQESPDCKLFLLSLKAGGVGLNLTAADYVFLLDPWWNPAVESQAIDRAHRIGQQKAVFAYRIIARDTVEERILELQAKKRTLKEAILPTDEGFLKQLTIEDLAHLLK